MVFRWLLIHFIIYLDDHRVTIPFLVLSLKHIGNAPHYQTRCRFSWTFAIVLLKLFLCFLVWPATGHFGWCVSVPLSYWSWVSKFPNYMDFSVRARGAPEIDQFHLYLVASFSSVEWESNLKTQIYFLAWGMSSPGAWLAPLLSEVTSQPGWFGIEFIKHRIHFLTWGLSNPNHEQLRWYPSLFLSSLRYKLFLACIDPG